MIDVWNIKQYFNFFRSEKCSVCTVSENKFKFVNEVEDFAEKNTSFDNGEKYLTLYLLVYNAF